MAMFVGGIGLTYAQEAFEELSQLVMKHRGMIPDQVDRSMRGEAVILRVLEQSGSLTPSQLSQLVGLSSGRVSSLLKSLEEKGLVRRSGDEQDRRNVHVVITESGSQRNQVAHSMMQEDICWIFEQMGKAQTQEFIRLCSFFVQCSGQRFQMRVKQAATCSTST